MVSLSAPLTAAVVTLLLAFASAGVDVGVDDMRTLRGGASAALPGDDIFPIRGTNLGGWLVLEPWITPSLFNQFQSMPVPSDSQPRDMLNFCKSLGTEEANRQLQKHWNEFVNEEDIRRLAATKINLLRIPVGYWLWGDSQDEFCKGVDGSAHLVRVLDLCHKYGIRALIDLHGGQGSQNGFDNSGMFTTSPQWSLREDYLNNTLDTLKRLAQTYGSHPAVWGIEAINEPGPATDLAVLKPWYYKAYDVIHTAAPNVKVVLHDAFRCDAFSDFMLPTETETYNIIIDTHIYQAFGEGAVKMSVQDHFNDACNSGNQLAHLESKGQKYFVGEFSLAMDDCATWLLGYHNASVTSQLGLQCAMAPCPGMVASPNPGRDGPDAQGMCPTDRVIPDADAKTFTSKQLNSYETKAHGWTFWNFKTEVDVRWDFMRAHDKGWFPADLGGALPDDVQHACDAPKASEASHMRQPRPL